MKNNDWIKVEPLHCHQRLAKNTLVEKLRVASQDKRECEILLKINPAELEFFFDHAIDHIPGMVCVNALRQAALALSHLIYGVPQDYTLAINWLDAKFYSFGELGVETIVRIYLIAKKEAAGRIELSLNGVMTQADRLVMTMEGKMLALAPRLAKLIKRAKPGLQDLPAHFSRMNRETSLTVAEVHAMIEPKEFSQVCDRMEETLRHRQVSRFKLTPLYLTFDQDDSEARICLVYDDPKLLGDFLAEKIRTIPGIKATRVRLTLDGKIYPCGLEKLMDPGQGFYSAHIFLKIDPAEDDIAWEALRALPDTLAAFPVWAMRDFYEYDRDVSLRIMGKDREAIEKYLADHISGIKGVAIRQVKYMKKLVKLQDDQTLLGFAQKWL